MRVSRPRLLAGSLALVAVGFTAVVATLPSSGAASADDLAGVHVLQQVSSVAELNGYRTALLSALNVPGVTVLAIRAPWNTVDANFAIFDRAREIADETGDQLAVRFMAGRHTPTRIKTACPMIGSGSTAYPRPFDATGAVNACFVGEYRLYVERLAVWARANDVREIHLSHYAQQWAEFYWGPEVQAILGAGAAGQTAMVNATNALADVGIDLSGSDLAFELPMSGHGPLMATSTSGPPGIAELVTQHVVSRIGTESDLFFIQGNGWDTDGIWGAPSQAVEQRMDRVLTYGALLGVQMIQPQQYNWTQVFDIAEAKHAVTAEVYLPSFTGSQSALLRSEIGLFNPYEPVVTPPPTTTTTVAPTTTLLPTTTSSSTSTTTTIPVGTCQAVWEGAEVEAKQTTQAACSLT